MFSDEGIGTMVVESTLSTLRDATIRDVGGILQLLRPLEEEGILVRRSRELLEREIDRFVIVEHDRRIIGCAALYPFTDEKAAELACLAVQPSYRDHGYGDLLLKHIAAKAQAMKLQKLFVLTTRTAHWFLERGFKEADVEQLPAQKKMLTYQRRSKVFVALALAATGSVHVNWLFSRPLQISSFSARCCLSSRACSCSC
jgi:amino-acid N-acetyltransferase